MQGYTPGEKRMLAAWGGEAGRMLAAGEAEDPGLPTGGRHYESITVVASPYYQGEFQLRLASPGNGSLRVNLDAGDLAGLRAALPGRQGATAAEVRDFLIRLQADDRDPGHQEAEALQRVIALLDEG